MPPGTKHISELRYHIVSRRFPSFRGSLGEHFDSLFDADFQAMPDSVLDEIIENHHGALFPSSYYGDDVYIQEITLPVQKTAYTEDEEWREKLRAYLVMAQDYLSEIFLLSYEELERVYHDVRKTEISRDQLRQRIEDRERFFSATEALADFHHWQKMAKWTPDEASALILGRDPRVVNIASLAAAEISREASPFARQYHEIFEIISRAADIGEISSPLRPQELHWWLLTTGIKPSDDFHSWADKIFGELPHPKLEAQPTSQVAPKIHGKTERSYQKLILGLTVLQYKFDANYDPAVGSKIFAQISKDLRSLNISIDPDTVAAHLIAATTRAQSEVGVWVQGKLKKEWR